jgi:transposase InsO family protein
MARSHVWWPQLDSDIEDTARKCTHCIKTKNAPPLSPLLPWTWPSAPWKRIHIDFATHEEKHYLVLVDAHSKWPEVVGPMKRTNAESTINALSNIFTRYGFPEQIVSDNGPPFQSTEYAEFLKLNGIHRVLVSPYHPASNGQAERFVQTLKKFLKASTLDGQLHKRIQNFLLTYRSTQHATTGVSPSKLFLQREVRTRLSLVRPNITLQVENSQSKMKSYYDLNTKFREIPTGGRVLARDHLSSQKWQPGAVSGRQAPYSYQVLLDDGRSWNRHIDDLLEHGKGNKPTESLQRGSNDMVPTSVLETSDAVLAKDKDDTQAPVVQPAAESSGSTEVETTLRRSQRTPRPPKRLIEDI